MNTVIFACVHNAGRSRMAASWFNQLSDPAKARAVSAGTEPASHVHPEVLQAMREVGIEGTPGQRALRLAKIARDCGVDGVVCSAHEVRRVRKACGKDFVICTQGMRPAGSDVHDQKRVATPAEAIRVGATYVGLGRAITQAKDPVAVAEAVAREVGEALRR